MKDKINYKVNLNNKCSLCAEAVEDSKNKAKISEQLTLLLTRLLQQKLSCEISDSGYASVVAVLLLSRVC